MADRRAIDVVRRAAISRRRAEENWRRAIIEAHGFGCSLREIAAAAGVSHVRVLQLLREHQADSPVST